MSDETQQPVSDWAKVYADLAHAQRQLTDLQERNTALVLQNRQLKARVGIAGALAQVREFHEKFGVANRQTPGIPGGGINFLRKELIKEEFFEFLRAWNRDDLVEMADALADLTYVILGTALSYGIPLDPVFNEVHRSNMLKTGGATRPDGKILKPEGWQPPDIESILESASERNSQ